MTLMRVTAELDAPLATTEALHLDGVLAAVHPEAHNQPISRSSPYSEIKKIPVPISKVSWRGKTVALCSAAQLPSGGQIGRDYIVRRKDGEDIDHLARPYNPGFGPGKNSMKPVITIAAPEIAWLVVGNWQGVKKALRHVLFVGQLRAQGYGAVRRWRMDRYEREADRLIVLHDGLVAQRHLPAEWCDWSSHVDDGATRPPYWHPAMAEKRVAAGTKCSLHIDVVEKCRAAQ